MCIPVNKTKLVNLLSTHNYWYNVDYAGEGIGLRSKDGVMLDDGEELPPDSIWNTELCRNVDRMTV